MNRFPVAVLLPVVLASCSKPAESPLASPQVSQASPSPATQSSAPSAPVDNSPISVVTVRYESVKPDVIVVNGRSLPLAELPAQFPAEWRRLPLPRDLPFHGPDEIRIHVDAATPFAAIRQIHDVAHAAGSRNATLVVDGYAPPPSTKIETHPLRFELPITRADLVFNTRPSEVGGIPRERVVIESYHGLELLSFRVQSGDGGKPPSVSLERDDSSMVPISDLNQFVSPKAVWNQSLISIIPDDMLRADQLAALLFACEYALTPRGDYEPLALRVLLAAPDHPQRERVQDELTRKLDKKIEPGTTLAPPGTPANTSTTEGVRGAIENVVRAPKSKPSQSPTPPKRSALFGRPLDQSGVPQPVKTPPM